MAIGDDAQAAGMELVPPTSPTSEGAGKVWNGWRELNRTRDYIAQFFTSAKAYADGILVAAKAYTDAAVGSISLTWGAISGKPSTFPPDAHGHTAQQITPGTGYFGGGGTYGFPTDIAANGSIYSFGRSTVVSSYVAAYWDGSGRLGVSPSALKYKRDIADYDGSALSLRPVTYVLIEDEKETVRVGIVADEANEIEPMLVVHEDGEVEGFKYELLAVALLRDLQREHAARLALEERVGALESREE